MFDIIFFPVFKLLNLSIVPVLYRTVISGDPAVNLRLFSAVRAGILFAVNIAVILADGVGRRNRIVWKLIILGNLPYKKRRFLPARKLLSQECVEYGSRCIERLKLVLNIQRVKNIIGKSNRKMGTVRIVWSTVPRSEEHTSELQSRFELVCR